MADDASQEDINQSSSRRSSFLNMFSRRSSNQTISRNYNHRLSLKLIEGNIPNTFGPRDDAPDDDETNQLHDYPMYQPWSLIVCAPPATKGASPKPVSRNQQRILVRHEYHKHLEHFQQKCKLDGKHFNHALLVEQNPSIIKRESLNLAATSERVANVDHSDRPLAQQRKVGERMLHIDKRAISSLHHKLNTGTVRQAAPTHRANGPASKKPVNVVSAKRRLAQKRWNRVRNVHIAARAFRRKSSEANRPSLTTTKEYIQQVTKVRKEHESRIASSSHRAVLKLSTSGGGSGGSNRGSGKRNTQQPSAASSRWRKVKMLVQVTAMMKPTKPEKVVLNNVAYDLDHTKSTKISKDEDIASMKDTSQKHDDSTNQSIKRQIKELNDRYDEILALSTST